MEHLKFRRAHYDINEKFICFTYWGKINHLKEHSEDCFMSPTMVSDAARTVDSIMMSRQTHDGKELFVGDVLHLHVTVEYSEELFDETEEIEQEIVVDLVWNYELEGFDIQIIDKDVHISVWCLGCGEKITLLGNIFESPELFNYKL